MTADLVAFLLIAAMALPVTVYWFVYTFTMPWWKSVVGRALWTKATGMALLIDISLTYQIFGDDYFLRDAVRLTVFSIILVGLWLQLGALLHEKRRAGSRFPLPDRQEARDG